MQRIFTLLCLIAFPCYCSAQSVGIGTTSPSSSAQLDITSTSRGLLIPRMTSSAVTAITNPAKGLLVYDTTRNQLLVNMGTNSAPNWQNIIAGSGWTLSGNTGTNSNSQYIGTNDSARLIFRVNSQFAGEIDSANANTAFGYRAGSSNTLPNSGSTAIGAGASQNGSGYFNTAVGAGALQSNTGGGQNVAIGNGALQAATFPTASVAVGEEALSSVQSGEDNVGIGFGALLESTVASDNIAIGSNAMVFNHTGQYNVAIGSTALYSTTASEYNTALGYNAGWSADNGYNNVFLGANCDVNGAGYYNVIAIGQDVICTGSSQARIGNEATVSIGGYANWTNFSDGRYKKNIQENVKGLDFVLRLRPITYNLDVTGIRSHLGKKVPKDAGTAQSLIDRGSAVFSGFSAQEVEKAASAAGYDFSGVDKPKNANDFYGLRYSDFVVPLVKAVQEQQQMIKALQEEVAELKKQLQH
jgi:hypothetical protein